MLSNDLSISKNHPLFSQQQYFFTGTDSVSAKFDSFLYLLPSLSRRSLPFFSFTSWPSWMTIKNIKKISFYNWVGCRKRLSHGNSLMLMSLQISTRFILRTASPNHTTLDAMLGSFPLYLLNFPLGRSCNLVLRNPASPPSIVWHFKMFLASLHHKQLMPRLLFDNDYNKSWLKIIIYALVIAL